MMELGNFVDEERVKELLKNEEFKSNYLEFFKYMVIMGGVDEDLKEWLGEIDENKSVEELKEWVKMIKKFVGGIEEFGRNL